MLFYVGTSLGFGEKILEILYLILWPFSAQTLPITLKNNVGITVMIEAKCV